MSGRPTILMTGYWPPTNEMLRPWSPPVRDWDGLGHDVAAHFPEFGEGEGPGTDRPWGAGEMQVDYRRTFEDFTRLVERYEPAAIITFSRCRPGSHWRVEPACRRWRLPGEADHGWPGVAEYVSDGREPGFPLGLPPTNDPPDTRYASTLPTRQIAEAVTRETAGRVRGYVPTLDSDYDYGGPYLSGYVGLLGTSYQSRTPGCLAAGHVHVGRETSVEDAKLAVAATLRQVIHHGGTETRRTRT